MEPSPTSSFQDWFQRGKWSEMPLRSSRCVPQVRRPTGHWGKGRAVLSIVGSASSCSMTLESAPRERHCLKGVIRLPTSSEPMRGDNHHPNKSMVLVPGLKSETTYTRYSQSDRMGNRSPGTGESWQMVEVYGMKWCGLSLHCVGGTQDGVARPINR